MADLAVEAEHVFPDADEQSNLSSMGFCIPTARAVPGIW